MNKEKYRTWVMEEKTLLKIDIRYYPSVEIWEERNEFTEYQLKLSYKNRWEQVYLKSLSKWQIFKAILKAFLILRKNLKQDRTEIKYNIRTESIKNRMAEDQEEYKNYL